MIMAYDRYDPNRIRSDGHFKIAEYAIYKQYDDRILLDALSYSADYRLVCVGEETFPNMAKAICHATKVIEDMEDMLRRTTKERKCDE